MEDESYISLVDPSNGTYINTIGNIVVTNNTSLNSIFQTHQVSNYENNVIRCSCNLTNLYNDFLAIPSVISSSNLVMYVVLLNNQSFNDTKPTISPNPFVSTINIEPNDNISTYSIFDVTGKQISKTSSKVDFDNKTEKLNSGMYLLKIDFENGEFYNQKLIKN